MGAAHGFGQVNVLKVAPVDHGLNPESVPDVGAQICCTCHSNPVPQGKLPNW